jgi:hypothetical protein
LKSVAELQAKPSGPWAFRKSSVSAMWYALASLQYSAAHSFLCVHPEIAV